MCSSRRVIAPTVSASSGSFSSPTLMFGTKISHDNRCDFALLIRLWTLRFLSNVLFDCFDLFAEGFGFLELFLLTVLFEERGVAEPDVLDFACEFVFPFGHVHFVWFPNYAFPISLWIRCVWWQVEYNVVFAWAILPFATLRMIASSSEEA